MRKGKVFIVGAGPGDPGLLTLRAKEVLSRAEAVLYDALVHPRILAFIPPGAKRIFRGSRGRKGSLGQEGINRLLVKLAGQGKDVVRLKGGDPFVFGRGAEEGLALRQAGIPFEVVPGVSASVAVPAYAGIPVTHREFNSSFTIVTGHEDPSKKEPAIDWAQLSEVQGTLVFLMGLRTLPSVVSQLIRYGKDPRTPAAAIQSGTTFRQRKVVGALEDLPGLVRKADLEPPVTVVVGKVVGLSQRLDWLRHRPLWGLRILVTRGRSQSNALTEKLLDQGAEVLEIPTIEIHPSSLGRQEKAKLGSLWNYDWVVFSSVNAVELFMQAREGTLADGKGKWKAACVGEATAKALRSYGSKADLVPKDYKQEGLAKAFRGRSMKGKRVLVVGAKEGRDVLERSLLRQGAGVERLALYENRVPAGTPQRLQELFRQGEALDLVTFASSSAVDHFYGAFPPSQHRKWLAKLPAAVIGPVTAASVRKWRGKVVVRPKRSTVPDLVSAILGWAQKRPLKRG